MQPEKKFLNELAIVIISLAKEELTEEDFKKLSISSIQRLVVLITECIPQKYLLDKTLLRHALAKLLSDQSPEETVMHLFTLYIFRLSHEGSNHPLERGIIKQQIMGILPIFENAVNKSLIKPVNYHKNADTLAHIANYSDKAPEVLEALSIEYSRFKETFY